MKPKVGMSVAKKFKGKAQKPPLSAVDIAIYVAAMILSIAFGMYLGVLFMEVIPQKLAYADPNVIGCVTTGYLFAFPLIAYFAGVLPGIIGCIAIEKKIPLFGNPRYKAPAFSHAVQMTPVFSPEFRERLGEEQKKHIRKIVGILVAVLLVCLLFLPFSLRSRYVFTQEQEFFTYDCLNRVKGHYRVADATQLGIEARYYNGRHRDSDLTLNFVIPGADDLVRLDADMLDQMTTEEALRYMLELKALFPPETRSVWGTEYLERVLDHREYTLAERALVYELFDMKP